MVGGTERAEKSHLSEQQFAAVICNREIPCDAE